MGLFDDIGKIGSDIVDAAGSVVSDVADTVGDGAQAVGEFAGGAAEEVWNRGVDSIETFGSGLFGAMGGAVRNLLEAGETYVHGWGELLEGDVGDAIEDWTSGAFKAYIQTPVDFVLMAGGGTVSAVETMVGLEPVGRELTDAEIAELRRVFGDSLDYSAIRIKEGDNAMTIGGNARTVGNTIYIPEGKLTNALLVHEATHAWQYQQGGTDYMSESLSAQCCGEGYDYQQGIDAGKSWQELNPEQQAELMEQAYANGYFTSTPPMWNGRPDLTAYMNQAIQDLRAGRGAT